MPMESPDSNVPKIESETTIETQIAEQEKLLDENTEGLLSRTEGEEFFGRRKTWSSMNLDERLEEIDAKIESRLPNWSSTVGAMFATFGAVMGNPGGLEGLQIGAERMLEGGVVGGSAAIALWTIMRLKLRLQQSMGTK